jgi:hypothetical protein
MIEVLNHGLVFDPVEPNDASYGCYCMCGIRFDDIPSFGDHIYELRKKLH